MEWPLGAWKEPPRPKISACPCPGSAWLERRVLAGVAELFATCDDKVKVQYKDVSDVDSAVSRLTLPIPSTRDPIYIRALIEE